MENTSTFEPGTEVLDLGLVRQAQRILSEILVEFPNRIHMTPIDCNRFGFGRPGGGGIGFAIDLGSRLRITSADKLRIHTNRLKYAPLIEHYLHVIQLLLSTREEFEFQLDVPSLVKQHFWLGSSVAVACAVFFGLNKMFGEPLSVEEMRKLIAHNFVEEFRGKVTRGLETGVGTAVIFRGGLAVVANELVEVFRSPLPNGYSVLLVDTATSRPEADKPESEAMLKRTWFLDSSYRYIKAYDLLMDVIPALNETNFEKVGNYIWDIQFSGTHLSMIQSYENFGRRIYEALGILRGAGAEICGLSSVGPAIYVVCHDERRKAVIETFMRDYAGGSVTEVKPNNSGIKVVESGF